MQDIRFGFRMLLKQPGVTFVAILTLAIGIGANTAIFSVIDAVLLRPLPYDDPERLVFVWGENPQIGTESASLPDFADWRSENQTFEAMGGLSGFNANITGEAEPERVVAVRVTHDLLPLLGARPEVGRVFLPEEDRPGAERVVMLSHAFWNRRYGADPNVVGQAIQVNGEPAVVVGILPRDFRWIVFDPEIVTPLAMDPAQSGRRSDFLTVIGRLKPSVTIAAAQSELAALMQRLAGQYPQTNANWSVKLVPMHEEIVDNFKLALLALLGAVGCVLLIACANVANLLLARAEARQKEMAIRAALGAGRARLVRQLLVESVVLAIAGGGLGLLVAVWGREFLLAVSPVTVPRMNEAALDSQVLGFALGLSILTGLVFGLAPALHVTRVDLNEPLKQGGKGTSSSPLRMRGLLVATQTCLALVLLVGMGLMIRSFQTLVRVDPGFDATNLLTTRINLPQSAYKDDARMIVFYDRLRESLANAPGVRAAAFTNAVPVEGGGPMLSFQEEGVPTPPSEEVVDANVRMVSPNYHEAIGIPLVSGRYLDERDDEKARKVIVINQAMARKFWPDRDPVGRRIAFGSGPDGVTPDWLEIVGVVGDVRHEGLGERETQAVYGSYRQRPGRGMAILLRTESDPALASATVRGVLKQIDPNLPVYNVRTMDEILSRSVRPQRFGMLLLTVFGVIALLLAALGIYSVISFSVSRRTHEIGIRMALGARQRDVVAMIVGQGVRMAGAGLVAGAGLSGLLTWFLSSLLFGVSPFDPLAYVAAVAALAIVAIAACGLPARRATRVDPMVALRYE